MKDIKEDLFKAQEHISNAIEHLNELEKLKDNQKLSHFPQIAYQEKSLMLAFVLDTAEKEILVQLAAEVSTNGPITKKLLST